MRKTTKLTGIAAAARRLRGETPEGQVQCPGCGLAFVPEAKKEESADVAVGLTRNEIALLAGDNSRGMRNDPAGWAKAIEESKKHGEAMRRNRKAPARASHKLPKPQKSLAEIASSYYGAASGSTDADAATIQTSPRGGR